MKKEPKHTQQIGMTVQMKRVRRFVEKMKNLDDTDHVSFEMILTAFFPNAWNNIMEYSNKCYMEGFVEGRRVVEEKKDEDQGNN